MIQITLMVVAKVRERLAVSKQTAQKLEGERFNLKKLKDLEVKKQYQIVITDRCSAFGNISDDGDINRAWENIKENIKTSAKESLGLHELKQHKPWFDEECLHFLDETDKLQWVQYPSQRNADNLKNVRREASRHFRKKRRPI